MQPFQAETRQLLLKIGVYANKLPELEKAGLEDDQVVAIIRQTHDEYPGEQKAGLIVYRILNRFSAAEKYFAEPCAECGKFGDHAFSCLHHPYAQYLSGSVEDDDEDDESPEAFWEEAISDPIDPKITHAWAIVLEQLQYEMPRASYDTWVRDTKPLSFAGGCLKVGVRNSYARDWLDSRLSSTVSRLLIGVMNRTVDVQFVVADRMQT